MLTTQLRAILADWHVKLDSHWDATDSRRLAYRRLTSQIGAMTDYTVYAGPYKGMRYFGPHALPIIDRNPTTKLLGSFEQELHPWIESLVDEGFRQVVHVGAGSGYHAVGLAMRMSESMSVVFDSLIPARKACIELAKQNNVYRRTQIRGYCGSQGLSDLDLAGSLMFVDCGGGEHNVLDPIRTPSLRLATILVETHDALDSRITPALRKRFASTHRMETKASLVRDPAKFPALREMAPSSAQSALDEDRCLTSDGKTQTWVLLRPYSS